MRMLPPASMLSFILTLVVTPQTEVRDSDRPQPGLGEVVRSGHADLDAFYVSVGTLWARVFRPLAEDAPGLRALFAEDELGVEHVQVWPVALS